MNLTAGQTKPSFVGSSTFWASSVTYTTWCAAISALHSRVERKLVYQRRTRTDPHVFEFSYAIGKLINGAARTSTVASEIF